MSTYKYIVNPASGRRVLSDGKIGQQIIRNYLNEYQQGGASFMRSAKAAGASVSRGVRSAAKSSGAAASKLKKAALLKKDKAAWAGMSIERKCEFSAQLAENMDEESGKPKCTAYHEAKDKKAAAKLASQKAELDTLTTQMNTHVSMATDLSSKMELDLAQDQMLKARLVGKEIALLTGKSYVDPFGLGGRPSGTTVKANTQAGGRKATKKQLANLAKGRAALAKKRKSNKRKSH